MAANFRKIAVTSLATLILLPLVPVVGSKGTDLGELQSMQSGKVNWFYTDGVLHKPLDTLTGCSRILEQRNRIEQFIAHDQIQRATTILPAIFMLGNKMSTSFCGDGSLHAFSGFSPNLFAWAVEIVVLFGAIGWLVQRRRGKRYPLN